MYGILQQLYQDSGIKKWEPKDLRRLSEGKHACNVVITDRQNGKGAELEGRFCFSVKRAERNDTLQYMWAVQWASAHIGTELPGTTSKERIVDDPLNCMF